MPDYREERKLDFKGSERKDKIEDIAAHESAHAFAVWWYGGILHEVTIMGLITDSKNLKKSPNQYYCKFANQDLSEIQEAIALRAEVALAAAAQDVESGKEISGASLNDISELVQILTWENLKVQKMAAESRLLLKDTAVGWRASLTIFFEKCGTEVKKVVAQPLAQKAIAKLSEKLLSDGTVKGHEAATLFEETWGGKAGQALPGKFHSKDSKIGSLPAAIKSTSQLTKLALDLLRGYRERDVGEEKIIDQIATKLVETLLELDQAFSRL
jgi:hypothetical protein